MKRPSQQAVDFVRELAELSYRLAAKDIVVASLQADWSSFGCWLLQARRGGVAVRVFWDGRDGVLSIESSPIRFASAPNEWKRECSRGFDRTDGGLHHFVEDYLTKRLGHDGVA